MPTPEDEWGRSGTVRESGTPPKVGMHVVLRLIEFDLLVYMDVGFIELIGQELDNKGCEQR